MLGRHHGHVIHQGQVVADALHTSGYEVTTVSAHVNRYMRLAEIVAVLVRNRRSFDALVLQVYGGPSFVVEDIASRLGQYFGQPIVMVLHGGAMPAFMARFPRWSRRVLSRATILVAPSQFLARAVRPYGLQARVIPNTIALEAYEYRHRPRVQPRLFWMRSFHDTYNPMMAVRALARLKQSYPEAHLVMAGQDSGSEVAVRQAAGELGLADSIEFPGFLDLAGKCRYGRNTDIFLNTNRIDNMPVAIVEAAAMGLPVVTTGVGGIPDLITNGETGLVVPDDDHEAMAAAIERLLTDDLLAARLSSAGRRLAERSSWRNVRPQWDATLEDALAASGRPGRLV
jgi:glycosyltransferase involved in cell wall biosynthesis